jgi:hypothetical protein
MSGKLLRILPVLAIIISGSIAVSKPSDVKRAPAAELIAATPDSMPGSLEELPQDAQGRTMVGRGLPFLLCLRVPRDNTLADGMVSTSNFFLAADADLGDPAHGGVAAGQNLAPLMEMVSTARTFTLVLRFDASLTPSARCVSFNGGDEDRVAVQSGVAARTLLFDDPVSLRADVAPLLAQNCFPCHDHFGHTEQLDLTKLGIFKTAVNKRAHETPNLSCARLRIKPFDPKASYLMHKIDGTYKGGCVNGGGGKMPLFGPYLDITQIALIRRWIVQGCQDN